MYIRIVLAFLNFKWHFLNVMFILFNNIINIDDILQFNAAA